MTMLKNTIITDALLPSDTIGYYVSHRLAAEHPDRCLLSVDAGGFDLDGYARAGHCACVPSSAMHAESRHWWAGPSSGLKHRVQNAWFEVTWCGEQLSVLLLVWDNEQLSFILADTRDVAERFVAAVFAWSAQPKDSVLVYENNHWHKDEDLLQAIRGASFDNLILDVPLKQEIRADLARFFSSRAAYEEYDVPWKRGILFIGPPGNGKTHTVKALVNEFGCTCLYVKELLHTGAIHEVFGQARRSTPCILVLEDLDTLAKADLRSALLNELDGFAANTGIVTLATTNHPEKLDAAVLHRPSRFDRTYSFDLPGLTAREAYLRHWNVSLLPSLQLHEEAIPHFADQTEGFSFAYLKELVVSAAMRWIDAREHGAMAECMGEQLAILRGQIAAKPAARSKAKAAKGRHPH